MEFFEIKKIVRMKKSQEGAIGWVGTSMMRCSTNLNIFWLVLRRQQRQKVGNDCFWRIRHLSRAWTFATIPQSHSNTVNDPLEAIYSQHHQNQISFVLIPAFCSRLSATSTVHPFPSAADCYCSSIDTTIKTFHDTHKFIINCQFSHASTFVCSAPRRARVERDGKSYNLHKIEIIKFAASRIAFN